MPKDETAVTPAADHNSRLIDPDVFLPLYAAYQRILADEAEVRGRKNKCRKQMKAAGVTLKVFDAMATLAELPMDQQRDQIQQQQELLRYLRAPIGHQFSLLDRIETDPLDTSEDSDAARMAPIIEDARAKGFLHGVSGREADNPHEGNSEPGLAYQEGWNDGVAIYDKAPEPMANEDED